MDAFSDPDVSEVVGVFGGQQGKTEALNNVLGYHIDLEPAEILFIMPTERLARYWSKRRLAPMLRDTPVLRGRLTEANPRKSGSEILEKEFPGGSLGIVGANAPTGLVSRPCRVVLGDELDLWPLSVGGEGDPVTIVRVRTSNFWNRKLGWISTPTVKGQSRIWDLWEETDQRRFFVHCPLCGESQTLEWGNVHWPPTRPITAYYCASCDQPWSEADRLGAVEGGSWVATRPFDGRAGFHISALYSPWQSIEGLVDEWQRAQGDQDKLQAFVNTRLAELWEEDSDAGVEVEQLIARREEYAAQVPAGVAVVTAGVDTAGDRIEVSRYGWGFGRECWAIDHQLLYGDPHDLLSGRDPRLDEVLAEQLEHELGVRIRVSAACVDSGDGPYNDDVYRFCARRRRRKIYATKGRGGSQLDLWPHRASKSKKAKAALADLRILGVDKGKLELYRSIRRDPRPPPIGQGPGPGAIHYPLRQEYDEEFFSQLMGERGVKKRGRIEWVPDYPRNEALDTWVLARAALSSLNADLAKVHASLTSKAAATAAASSDDDDDDTSPPPPAPRPRRRRRPGGFVRGWK